MHDVVVYVTNNSKTIFGAVSNAEYHGTMDEGKWQGQGANVAAGAQNVDVGSAKNDVWASAQTDWTLYSQDLQAGKNHNQFTGSIVGACGSRNHASLTPTANNGKDQGTYAVSCKWQDNEPSSRLYVTITDSKTPSGTNCDA